MAAIEKVHADKRKENVLYCPNCRAQVADNTARCPNCNYDIASALNSSGVGSYTQHFESVDYIPESDRILRPEAAAGYQTSAGMGTVEVPADAKNRNVAALLALLFGAWGLHLFYLGYYKQGAIMVGITILLAVVTAGMGLGIAAAYGIIMGIRYLTMDKRTWYATYILDRSNAWW